MTFARALVLAGILLTVSAPALTGRAGASVSRRNASGLSPAAALGKKIFFDPGLSASGKLACATCHDPRFAYGPPNGKAVPYGGPEMKSPDYRAVPSLRYTLDHVPLWTHIRATSAIEQLTEPEEVPAGGYTWDGRFNSLHTQAAFPLFSPVEMDNRSAADLAERLRRASYAGEFRAVFGAHVFDHPERAVMEATMALQDFELEDHSFHPYSSKFDRWLNGKAKLTPQELRGKQLFDDPNGGNCASCHLDERGANGAHPLFTDFQFEAVGVPRNPEIPWNRNAHYFDLGLCGPFRRDAASRNAANCGYFRTPSLRNVATRRVFFHNGRFHSLREVLLFYVERDTNPAKWYPTGPDGKVEKFDDLPPQYRQNADTTDAPFGRSPGQKPVWDTRDIDDVMAFLRTLDDADVAAEKNTADRKAQGSSGPVH